MQFGYKPKCTYYLKKTRKGLVFYYLRYYLPGGKKVSKAVGDKKGIRRYGHSYIPLDEALSRVVLDFSGRPGLFMKVDFVKEEVGGIDVNMFEHFFQSFCNHAFIN